jgi:hypothetical protein
MDLHGTMRVLGDGVRGAGLAVRARSAAQFRCVARCFAGARYFKIFGSNATMSAAPNWSSIKTSCFLVSSSSQRLFFFFPFLLHLLQRQMSDYIPTFDLNVLATEDDEDDVGFDLNIPATQVDDDNDMINVSELQDADDNEPQDDNDNDVDVDDEP